MTTKKEKLNAQQGFNQFLFETMMDRIRGAELLGQDIQKLQGQIDAMKSVYPAHRINHGAIHDTIERQNKQICSLFSRIEKLEAYPKTGEEARRYWQVPDQRFVVVEEQNRKLNERVEKLEGQLNFKLNDGPIANHSKRIADLEETAEALSETVDQLSTCKCEAGAGMLKRITELERQNTNALEAHRISGLQMTIIMKRLAEREVDVEQLQISRGAEMLYENEANKRLEGIENRLSRAQDMIAEMHKEGFIPIKQPQRKRVQSP